MRAAGRSLPAGNALGAGLFRKRSFQQRFRISLLARRLGDGFGRLATAGVFRMVLPSGSRLDFAYV